MNNPFDLSKEFIWLVEIIVPSVLVIVGWLALILINNINLRKDKLIDARIKAYDYLREAITKAITINNEWSNYLFDIHNKLKFINDNKNDVKIINKELYVTQILDDYEENKYFKLSSEAARNYCDFIFTWEGYQILFKELELHYKELYDYQSLIYEYDNEVLLELNEVLHDLNFQNGLHVDEELLNVLSKDFQNYLNLVDYLRDFSGYLQNITFSKLSHSKVKDRKPEDKTIKTLNEIVKK